MASDTVTFKHNPSSGKRVKTSAMLSKGNYEYIKDNPIFLSMSDGMNFCINFARIFGDKNAKIIKMFVEKEMAEKQ